MILELPDDMPALYMRGIHLISVVSIVVILFYFSVVFFNRSKSSKIESQKWVLYSYGLFALSMALCRVFFILAFHDIAGAYNLLLHIGFLFGSLSFCPVIYVYEKFLVTKTKKTFTIISLILLGISIYGVIDPTQKTLDIISQRIGGPVLGIIFAYLYIIILKSSSGELRRDSVFMLIGMLFVAIGIIFDSYELILLFNPSMWISSIGFLIGAVLVGSTQKKK